MCLTPVYLKKTTIKQRMMNSYQMQQVPCGKCLECKKQRSSSWYLRLKTELKTCDSALFVTFTYDDNQLNFTPNGNMSLYYRDLQLMFKRLRKRNHSKTQTKIKYYAVGEYGAQTFRPHYHAIIFNVHDSDDIRHSWPHGFVDIGTVTDASIHYTLKYIQKSVINPIRDELDDRHPEKALMSKGLGIDFLTPQMVRHLRNHPAKPVTMRGNHNVGLPRYYRDKIFSTTHKLQRAKELKPFLDKRLERSADPLFRQRVEKMYEKSKTTILKTD